MKSLLRRYCVLIALLAFWLPQASAQNLPKVQKVDIRHVGPPAVSDELIRSNIRVKEGDAYTRTTVDDDVRNLYGTGFFYNIRVAEEPTSGGVNLVYIVQGKLRITDIRFEGNKQLSNSKLRKDVASKIGDPLDERKLFTDTQAILKHYQKSGYHKTQVKYSVEPNDTAGTGKVTYEITEAPRVKIQSIVFDGATAFSQKRLASVLKTKSHWMFSWLTRSDVLKDEQLEDDLERLADFYHNEGYIDFKVDKKDDVTYENVSPKYVVVHIRVQEGKQYKVGSVALKGNKLFPSEDITKGLKMGANALFTPKGLTKDEEHIRDYYGARGYIDSRVATGRNANTATGNIDLTYQVDEKDQVFIEKVDIKGNTKTKDKVIRRELAVSPGEVFDMVRVKRSKERLEGTQFFSKVEAQPEDTDVPNRKNLVVAVEEKNTGNLQLGAGFSTVDSIVGFVEVSQGNFDLMKPPTFTGGGQKFRLRASVGTVSQDYVLSFVEPWFLERKLAFGTDIYRRKQSYQSALYDEEQTGVSLSLTRALGSDFLIGKVSYTIENVGITGVDRTLASPELIAEEGHTLVSKIGTTLAYDTRGGGQLPNKGQRTELITELAGGPLGADADYYKFELRSSWYFKGFWEDHVIEAGAGAGVIESYGGSTRVPFFNRFFLGGPKTLRGFRYAQVGPRDSNGEPSGGETYWNGSLEYSLPIIDRLRFAFFYDVGNAYADSFSFNPNRAAGEVMFNDNVGFGFRLNIPQLGPLRLDYGIPLHADRFNGGGGKFNFSVGFSRDY